MTNYRLGRHPDHASLMRARHERASARQRVVVLTFPTVEDAEEWDAAPDDEALAGVVVERATGGRCQR